MAGELEQAVARHYGASDLAQRIDAGLAAAGLATGTIAPEALAPIDEFHIGGRAATVHAIGKMALTPGAHVLDIGCGLGGATRYLAAARGCRVTGIDLTPEYIAIADKLAQRTGLADRIEYRVASALDMPFADAAFDAAVTLHVAMNIADRRGLYGEIARVLKPGAVFCIYDVMQGPREGLNYPVPWAETPATSHLVSPGEMRGLLNAAGFEVVEEEDRTAQGIAFFRERMAAAAGGPAPALGLHLLTGANNREKFVNLLAGMEGTSVAAVIMIARRTG